MNEKVPDSLTESDIATLEWLRRAMRRLRLAGLFDNPAEEWDGEHAEEAIAHAEYLLGVLKPGLNTRLYGFGREENTDRIVVRDAGVDPADRLYSFLGMLRSQFMMRDLVPFGVKNDYSEAFQDYCVKEIDKIIPTLGKYYPEKQDL